MPKLENIGFIHFDIPEVIKRFGNRLRKRLRVGRALPASMSCYMVNWPDTPAFEKLIDDAKKLYAEKYPEDLPRVNRLIINVLKMDDATAEEAGQMALDGLNRLIAQIGDSLTAKLKKMKKAGEDEMPRRVQVTFIKKLQEIECLAMAFRMGDDVELALEAARKIVTAQIGVDVAEKYLKDSKVGASK